MSNQYRDGTERAQELLKGHPDQDVVAPLSLVAQGDLDFTKLSIDEWTDALRIAEVTVEVDHPAEKTAWALWDDADGIVLYWSNGRVERGEGNKAAIMMMAAASDCGVRVVHGDGVGDGGECDV